MKIMTTVNALFLFCAASVVAQAQPGHWKMFDYPWQPQNV
jgi:hypothetical protein